MQSSGVWVYDHLMPPAWEGQYPHVVALTANPYGTPSLVLGMHVRTSTLVPVAFPVAVLALVDSALMALFNRLVSMSTGGQGAQGRLVQLCTSALER